MKTMILKSAPSGAFEEISRYASGWEEKFLSLVQQGKPIKYDVFNMPDIPEPVYQELDKQGYGVGMIHDMHFLFSRDEPSKFRLKLMRIRVRSALFLE